VAGIEPALVLALQNRMAGDPLTGFEDTDLFGIDLNLDRSAPGAVFEPYTDLITLAPSSLVPDIIMFSSAAVTISLLGVIQLDRGCAWLFRSALYLLNAGAPNVTGVANEKLKVRQSLS
jgi:hypothetical protein